MPYLLILTSYLLLGQESRNNRGGRVYFDSQLKGTVTLEKARRQKIETSAHTHLLVGSRKLNATITMPFSLGWASHLS